jgi:hypothetical protein
MKKKIKVNVQVEQEIEIEFPYYYVHHLDSCSIYGKIEEVFTYTIEIRQNYCEFKLEKEYTNLESLQSYLSPEYKSSKETWDDVLVDFNEFYYHNFKTQ